jgi:hypothetical protein
MPICESKTPPPVPKSGLVAKREGSWKELLVSERPTKKGI